jgi:hypothetical protein
MLPVYLNDIYLLDLHKMEWEKITGNDILGTFPSARMSMGMVEINKQIVFYGGFGETGIIPVPAVPHVLLYRHLVMFGLNYVSFCM